MTTIKSPQVTWIDVKEPSPKELKFLAENYGLHPLIVESLRTPTIRATAEDLNGYVYVVLHFPVYNPAKKVSQPVEVDFIITPSNLISVRYEKLEPLDNFLQKCKSASLLKRNSMNESSIYLFHQLLKELYSFSSRQLDHIDNKISQIEDAIFAGHQKEMLFALSLSSSDILNFLRSLKPHASVLESLLAREDF